MTEGIKILLVDDEKAFIELMAKRLRRRKQYVITAESGPEALAQMENESFDVVICDVKMPGMNGIEVLQEIKHRFPDTEVIMLTGHATIESGLEGVRFGAFDYLMKPTDIEILMGKLEAAYENKTKRELKIRDAEFERDRGLIVEEIFLKDVIRRDIPYLYADSSLADAVRTFKKKPDTPFAEKIFVINDSGELLGKVRRKHILMAVLPIFQKGKIITGDDLTWKEFLNKGPGPAGTIPIGEIMNREVKSLGADSHILEAVKFMIENNLAVLPVVEGRKLLGRVRMYDLLLVINDIMAEAL
ncbi:MAG: response regulator [Deltaproteobacteria bacterium]|nr:response regulator [Deltaproteobacteria bacterium]MBW2619755.1 response regulator [Deltaproteobacteria bacterium]